MINRFVKSSVLVALMGFSFIAFAEDKPPAFESQINALSPDTIAKMKRFTWKEGCPVPFTGLAHIHMTYWGFDHKRHKGDLIVNARLAPEIVAIFKELYEFQYPIEKMQLMENFEGNDIAAMEKNNTSAFNCREVKGKPGAYSVHSYGAAVDINTMINPFVDDDEVLPKDGRHFVDRSQDVPGMIRKNDPVYNAFIKRGWAWGGDWKGQKDYQHFEKKG